MLVIASIMMIPGLDVIPIGEHEKGGIELVSFSGNFTIPKSQMFGNCRHITEFRKISFDNSSNSGFCFDKSKQRNVFVRKFKPLDSSWKSLENDFDALIREIQLLTVLKHDNVVQFYEAVAGNKIQNVYLTFECFEVSLEDLIKLKIGSLFERAVIKNIVSQMFQALKFMHQHFIMHRNLSPKSLRFSKEGFLKVADFQHAKDLNSTHIKLDINSWNYQAPEIILNAETYGVGVDIWSVGCILSELFLMQKLFSGDEKNIVLLKIFNILGAPNDTIWPGYSSLPGVKDFVVEIKHSFYSLNLYFKRHCPQTQQSLAFLGKIFIYDPMHRIMAEEGLQHPYFKENPQACSLEEVSKVLQDYESKRIQEDLQTMKMR